MTLQQLIYFCEISNTLNFTKASEKLYVSQSSLSHQILSLEHELGISLFVRNNGKNISLTRFGEKFLPYAKKVLEDVCELELLAKEEKDPLSGVVNIAYSYINGYTLIPEMVQDFMQDKTNENITLNFDVTHNMRPTESRILADEIDIAFNCNSGIDGIATYPVASQPLYVMVPTSHHFSERESLKITDIGHEPLIHYHTVSELRKRIATMFKNAGIIPNEVATYEDWSSQMAMVALGQGIAISPWLPVDSSRIKLIPLDDALSTRTVYMLWAADKKLSPVVEHVKQYCINFSKTKQNVKNDFER